MDLLLHFVSGVILVYSKHRRVTVVVCVCVAKYTMLSIRLNNSLLLKRSGNQPFPSDNAYLLQLHRSAL